MNQYIEQNFETLFLSQRSYLYISAYLQAIVATLTLYSQILGNLTPCRRDAAIGAVKIVFRPPAFQLLYSANARVNTMKEGLPWLLYIW